MGRRRGPLAVGEQHAIFRAMYPAVRTISRSLRRFVWGLEVEPTPVSDTYDVTIDYALHDVPRVEVKRPALTTRGDGQPIPHMYEQKYLCLYAPAAREWTADMAIAQTIVPWTSLWLKFYELWRVTGEWLGGGLDHMPQFPRRTR